MKVYNSSGVEVKRPIMRVCPTCGFFPSGAYMHCLRCGQPLRSEGRYVEQYKNLEEEIAYHDANFESGPFNTTKLSERRAYILEHDSEIPKYDVEALFEGKLVKIFPDGKRELEYEGINLASYDVE